MQKKFVEKLFVVIMGISLLLTAGMAVEKKAGYAIDRNEAAPRDIAGAAASEGTGYSLDRKTGAIFDLVSDNDNRLYVMWFNKSTIHFGEIVKHVIIKEQVAAERANSSKYCIARLSVSPNSKHASIIYMSSDQHSLMHAWRDGTGPWKTEAAYKSDSAKLYYPAGAVDQDGTVHAAFTKSGAVRYLYKKPGKGWTKDFDMDIYNSEGTRIYVDPKGGIHMAWMPYQWYLNYVYAPRGNTLERLTPERIFVDQSERCGIGDLFVSKSGIVHLGMADGRAAWHTYWPIGETFSKPTCASLGPLDTALEINTAVAADKSGRVYVVWAEGNLSETENSVKMSTREDGKWKVKTLTTKSNISKYNKPAMAINEQALYVLWNTKSNDDLNLLQIPLISVSSAVNVVVEQMLEKSFFKSYRFNQVTWEDDPFNIENNVVIDHYNVYRKSMSSDKYDAAPLAANIPAGSHSFEDNSAEVNTLQQNYDYYVTTVAMIEGKLVESEIIY